MALDVVLNVSTPEFIIHKRGIVGPIHGAPVGVDGRVYLWIPHLATGGSAATDPGAQWMRHRLVGFIHFLLTGQRSMQSLCLNSLSDILAWGVTVGLKNNKLFY